MSNAPGLVRHLGSPYDGRGVKTMNEILVQIGSGIAIALGVVHFASTKSALRDFKELAFDSHRMLLAMMFPPDRTTGLQL